jgi:hypothetical protein
MNDKVLVVTAPDDVLVNGPRICLVNLDPEQSKLISDILLNIRLDTVLVIYMWTGKDSTDWFLDKFYKSDLVIFNADTYDALTGFVSSSKKSYYFGNLKDLSAANPRVLYAYDDCKNLINSFIEKYE